MLRSNALKKVLVIDGQGGRVGALLVERLKKADVSAEIWAVGANSSATNAMLRAGADRGATGENPVVVACRQADIVMGPIGIIIADSLLGEITPKMSDAVSASRADKVLLPVNKCGVYIAGAGEHSLSELIEMAADRAVTLLNQD